MALFLSTFENKIDKKGRVSVPASFRQALAPSGFQGVVLFRSYKVAALDGMGLDRMEKLSASLDSLDFFSHEHDEVTAAVFADAHMLSFDSEGRILLPESLLVHASLHDTVSFVGRGATFQVWDPSSFSLYQEEARGRLKERARA